MPLTGLLGICLAFPLARAWVGGQVVLAMLASANYMLVFLSGSRGALLTASSCGFVLLILTRRMRARWLVAPSVALVAVFIASQFSDLQTRTIKKVNLLVDPRQSLDVRTSGRSELLADGWNIFREHPMGVGTGGYGETRVTLAGPTKHNWGPRPAHAGWIKILAENGVPGVVLMGAYVVSFTVAGWRSRNRDLLMLGFLVTLVLGLAFVSTEFQAKGLWLLVAAVMVFLRPGSVVTRNALRSA